jgi:creatinine amidohydrolase/Fe(II)-dependent formamide hydrolase-like protein
MPLRRWCRSGVFGDPTKASEAKGRRTVEAIVKALVRIVENLRRSALPEGGVLG